MTDTTFTTHENDEIPGTVEAGPFCSVLVDGEIGFGVDDPGHVQGVIELDDTQFDGLIAAFTALTDALIALRESA